MKLAHNAVLRFFKSASGNMGLTLGLVALPMVAIAGAAIDWARFVNAKTEVQATVDAAILAGTSIYLKNNNSSAAISEAENFYKAQIESSSSNLARNEITFKINDNKTGLSAAGNIDVKTAFLGVIGINSLPAFSENGPAISVAAGGSSGSNVEVSVMLDVTGSMCNDGSGPCSSDTKIAGVKAAATALVDNLIWTDQSKYSSKVALVPFNTMVRVEPDGQAGTIMKKLTNLNATWSGYYKTCVKSTGSGSSGNSEGAGGGGNWQCQQTAVVNANNWKLRPCVTDRFFNNGASFDLTDNAPGANRWMNAVRGNRYPLSGDSSDSVPSSGIGATSDDPIASTNYSSTGSCGETSNANIVVPLTNDKAKLKTSINGLTAYGGTSGALGTAFTWYMMSPNWSNVWPAASKAGSYTDLSIKSAQGVAKLRKIAVLMTDGGYNAYRSWKQQDISFVSGNAVSICNAMKAKGIEIYTVGFNFNSLSPAEAAKAKAALQSCATDSQHFYDSKSSSDLVAAFTEIANTIANDKTRLTN